MLGALVSINNEDFEIKLINDNIVLDVFIICQKWRHDIVVLENKVII